MTTTNRNSSSLTLTILDAIAETLDAASVDMATSASWILNGSVEESYRIWLESEIAADRLATNLFR